VDAVKVGKGHRTILLDGSFIGFLPPDHQKIERLIFSLPCSVTTYSLVYSEYPLEYVFVSAVRGLLSLIPSHSGDAYLLANYDIGRTLGAGHFGVVKLAVQKQTGKKVAVKEIDKKKVISIHAHHPTSILDEFLILRRLNHPHIVNVLDGFECASFTCVVME
jgi:serine/threonine protein kinase